MNSSPNLWYFLTLLCFTLLLSSCDRDEDVGPPVGKLCTIQFRRDALGAAATLPVSPMTRNINGADTSIEGILVKITEQWVVIEKGGKQVWVPKTVVLLIQE